MYNNESQLKSVIQNYRGAVAANHQRVVNSGFINDDILSQESLQNTNNHDVFNHRFQSDNGTDGKNDLLFKYKYFNNLKPNYGINEPLEHYEHHNHQEHFIEDGFDGTTNLNGQQFVYQPHFFPQQQVQYIQPQFSQPQCQYLHTQFTNERRGDLNILMHQNGNGQLQPINERFKCDDLIYNIGNNHLEHLNDLDNDENGHVQMFVRKENDNDTALPIANIGRLMKSVLPNSAKIAKQAKDMIRDCVTEFIQFIASEASDRCSMEHRKTLSAEDILLAMNRLGFEHYDKPLKNYHVKWKEMKGQVAHQNITNVDNQELQNLHETANDDYPTDDYIYK